MALNDEELAAALPGRPVHRYPALLSTEADALARARAGEPAGTLVVAGYQVSPRGRGGLPWELDPERDLGLSLVTRPDLPSFREGWLYLVACRALASVAGETAVTAWPDEVKVEDRLWGAVGVQTDPAEASLGWAVITVRIPTTDRPARQLADAVTAIEGSIAAPTDEVLDDYRSRCETLGRHVTARLVPMGPSGAKVTGVARDLRDDGALVLETRTGQRLAVPPQNLGRLDEAL